MSRNRFRGDAVPVAQVNTVTPASVTIGNIFTLTCNGKTIVYVAEDNTVATTCTALAFLVNNSSIPEFQEVAAVDNTTNFTLTAKTAGMPFTITSSAATGTGSGGCSLTTAATTASSGPNHWDDPTNWTLGLPVSTNDVDLTGTAVAIKYGLPQSAVTLNSLNADASFSGDVGLPDYNPAGYYEYRTKTLAISATTFNYAAASSLFRIDLGNNASTINVNAAGASAGGGVTSGPGGSGLPAPLVITGSTTAFTLNLLSGTVAVATDKGSIAKLGDVTLAASGTTTPSSATLITGSGCTLSGTIYQFGGSASIQSSISTIQMTGGSILIDGAGTVGTLNALDKSAVDYRSTGTITLAVVEGSIDFTSNLAGCTVTTLKAYSGCTVDNSTKKTTISSLQLVGCGLEDVTLKLGTDLTL